LPHKGDGRVDRLVHLPVSSNKWGTHGFSVMVWSTRLADIRTCAGQALIGMDLFGWSERGPVEIARAQTAAMPAPLISLSRLYGRGNNAAISRTGVRACEDTLPA